MCLHAAGDGAARLTTVLVTGGEAVAEGGGGECLWHLVVRRGFDRRRLVELAPPA